MTLILEECVMPTPTNLVEDDCTHTFFVQFSFEEVLAQPVDKLGIRSRLYTMSAIMKLAA